MKSKLLTSLATVAALCMGIAPATSQADIGLRLTSGTCALDITDGGSGDSNPLADVITYLGACDLYTINVTTGLGDGATPGFFIDLNSVNSSTGAGTLTIEFSENGLNWGLGGAGIFTANIGGTTQGTLSYNLLVSDAGTLFAGTSVVSGGPFGPGAFSDAKSGPIAVSDPFAVTLVTTITHSGAGTSSFDYSVDVPEPGTLALLGLGLAGFGLARRKRQ